MDYPQDNTTTPNTAVAKLNGNDPDKRIGPSIILRVMAGDTIQAAVRAYYKKETDPKKKVSIPAEQMLAGMLQALVAPGTLALATHSTRLATNARITGPGLTANGLQGLRQKDPNNINGDKPKAYLNYVFFDNQFKFVGDGSGVKQVDGEPGQLETLSSGKIVAKKNGYVYVYTSNESQQDSLSRSEAHGMLFDNFGVMDITGPVLEETHYYPFGLTMSAFSTTAPMKLENRFKFNGKELNHKEFSDGAGLDWYSYGMREYDPQIGRFFRVDPLANKYTHLTPYQYASNNPTTNIDIDGLEGENYLVHLLKVYLGIGDHPKTVDQAKFQAGERQATEQTLNDVQKLADTYDKVYGSIIPGYSAFLHAGEGKYGSAALYLGADLFGGELTRGLFKGAGELIGKVVGDDLLNETGRITRNILEGVSNRSKSLKASFTGGKYELQEAVKDFTVYRVSGGKSRSEVGEFFSITKPASAKEAEKLLNINKFGNTGTEITPVIIKKGQQYGIGGVEGETGTQIYIPKQAQTNIIRELEKTQSLTP